MAQGTRGRLLMAAAAGFGVVLCTGLAGCQNTDKSKDTKLATKQPAPGLPGTPRLDSPGAASRAPAYNYGAPGSAVQQTGGSQSPAMGLGAGMPPASQGQFGSSNGNNPLNTSAPSQGYGPSGMGAANPIGAPARPGTGFSNAPLGMNTPPSGAANPGGALSAYTPPAPILDITPPPPPSTGSAGAAAMAGPVMPPVPASLSPNGGGATTKPTGTPFSGPGVLPFSQ